MLKKALSCIMVVTMLISMISVSAFAADAVVEPNVLFAADFDGKNPTPTAIDKEIVSVGAPTMVNSENALKLAYDGSKKGVAYSVNSFEASDSNVIMFDINKNAGGASYFYIELWDAEGVGKVYRIKASYLAKNLWFTYMIMGDGTAYRKAVGAPEWEAATVDVQNSANGIAGTNKVGFLVNSGTATTVTYDVDNVSLYSSFPAISVTVPEKFGETYVKYALDEDFEETSNIFTNGSYGTGMKDIVTFVPETEGSENSVMDIDFSNSSAAMATWTQNIKSVAVDYPSPAVGFNVSFNYRRLDDYVNGDQLYFGTSYDANTRLVVYFDTSQFAKGEWYNITYDVSLNSSGKVVVDSKTITMTKISTGEKSTPSYNTGTGWSSSIVGTVAICASNNVDATAAARRNLRWQLDDIEVTYQAVDPVKTELKANDELGNVVPFIAAYDENGILMGALGADVNTVSGNIAETEFDVLESAEMLKNAKSVKVLYWDSLSNAKAYADAVEIGDVISAENSSVSKSSAIFELGNDMLPNDGTGKYTLFAYTVPFTVSESDIPAFDATAGDMLAMVQSNTSISEFKYDSALYDSEKEDIVIICNAEGAENAVVTLYEVNNAPAFTNVAMLLGGDETERNFTWYSLDGGVGKITYQKKNEMVDGAFSDDATVVTAGRCHDDDVYSNKAYYYQNEAVITGLEPGETYVYQLSNGNSKSEMYTIAIAEDDGSFSFAFAGDAQVGGSEYVDYDEETKAWGLTLKQITTAPEFEGIEFLLSAGDQVDTSLEGSVGDEAQYDIYLNHEELKTLPQAVVLGNHDAKLNGVHMQHFNEPNKIRKADGSYYGETARVGGSGLDGVDYYYVYDSVLFMHLNLNTFDDNSNALEASRLDDKADAQEHIEFINRVLEETKDNKDILWKVVTCHQSPFGSSYHGNYTYKADGTYSRTEQYDYINIREYLLPHFYEVGVDLVLSGHDHVYTRTHILKPTGADTNGHYFGSAEITPYANTVEDGANYYTYEDGTTSPTYKAWTDSAGMKFDGTTNPYIKVSSKPVKVTDPDGFMWVTGASSSGSQVNNMQYENHYAAVAMAAKTRHMSRFDVTPTSLTLNTYNLGTNTTENITLVDTFTIERTADVAVQGVSLPESETIAAGQKKTLVAKLSPADPANKTVSWKSDNEDVATVEDGVVTAISAGTANITVTTEDGGFTATCAVTVVDAVSVTAINLPETATMEALTTKTLVATVVPEIATTKAVAWSSNDADIATVDQNGNVTAHKNGEVTITATATDGSGISANCVITVTYIASTSSFASPELQMSVFEEEKLEISISPSNATFKDFVWTSSAPDVVSVDEKGNLKAFKQGTAVITAATPERELNCMVTVVGGILFEQNLENPGQTTFYDQIYADDGAWTRVQEEDGNWVLDVDGSKFTSKMSTVYTSRTQTNTNAVTMPSTGYTLDFDVKKMTAEGLPAINFRTYDSEGTFRGYKLNLESLEVGQWYDFKLTSKSPSNYDIYYKKATDAEWTKGSAFVDQAYNGSAIVNYNYIDIMPFFKGKSNTIAEADHYKTHFRMDNIRVYTETSATGMTVAEESFEMKVGDVKTISASFTPSYATDRHVVYTTSNPAVATVDRLGRITAVGGGNATITVTAVEGGYTDTVAVTVEAVIPEMTVVKDGSKFTVTTNVAVSGEKVYIAAYDVNDVMIGATVTDYAAEGTELTLSADGAAYYKAFIWGANAVPVIREKVFN